MQFKKISKKTLINIGFCTVFLTSIIVPTTMLVERHNKIVNESSTYVDSKDIDFGGLSAEDIYNDILSIDGAILEQNSLEIKKHSKSLNEQNETSSNDFIMGRINDAMNHVKKDGIDLNFLMTYLGGDINQYKNIFEGDMKGLEQESKVFNSNSLVNSNSILETYSSTNVPFAKLTSLVQNLRVARFTFISTSATAAVMSAGLWAAAWWFGISIPAAVQTGIAAAVLGAVAAGIQIALVAVDPELNNLNKATATFGVIINIGRLIAKITLASLYTAEAALTVSSWAFPLAWSIIPTIGWIIACIGYFD